jgi:hypothetical protein
MPLNSDTLKKRAIEIRDEVRANMNSVARVGSLFLEIVNKIADSGSGIGEVPDDGKLYGCQNGERVETGIDTFP